MNALSEVAFSRAATVLPVPKARMALERRRFLKNAETAFQTHEMTAEFCGLFAAEVYLPPEVHTQHDLRNQVKLEGELWDELVSSSSKNSHIQRATRLWGTLCYLVRVSVRSLLASGPVED